MTRAAVNMDTRRWTEPGRAGARTQRALGLKARSFCRPELRLRVCQAPAFLTGLTGSRLSSAPKNASRPQPREEARWFAPGFGAVGADAASRSPRPLPSVGPRPPLHKRRTQDRCQPPQHPPLGGPEQRPDSSRPMGDPPPAAGTSGRSRKPRLGGPARGGPRGRAGCARAREHVLFVLSQNFSPLKNFIGLLIRYVVWKSNASTQFNI